MLSSEHVNKSADEVEAYAKTDNFQRYSIPSTAQEVITEVWELDPSEVSQVQDELVRRGWDITTMKAI